ncbi:hypothetical protein LVW35_28505 [Pseudomonas sp. HN11]|uniref:hypothetical protein n=1 Tax=Pseudomonas sp. HN11 TaxID=1344094 RepID=UPI001F211BD2|nr:hypothetical protein [Pseudomonas sp. HN11]UII71518.1 hypothetical protein LVW35_28505 [Pseudomonas sp. HN11]
MTSTPPNHTRPAPSAAVIAQMSAGPTFHEVASALLREHLQAHYPKLDIDPESTVVGTPSWEFVDDQIVAAAPHYQALSDVLVRQAVLAVPAIYLEGEHFLTRLPIVEPVVHLPVRIDEIAELINVLAPVMIRAYQDRQVGYWNQSNGSGPYWHQLSSTLRDLWNVDQVQGWTTTDCLMARQLYRAPDSEDRHQDSYATRAYLLDIDEVDSRGKVRHLNEHLVTVLIGKQDGREVILTHSLLQGFDKFSTLEQLGQALTMLVDTSVAHTNLQWRLVEPQGNYFDHLACALIAIQIEAIGALDFSDIQGDAVSRAPLAAPPGSEPAASDDDLQWFQQALPDWLSQATSSDINAFSRHLKDLAALHRVNEGKTYLDAIAPIQTYALDQLRSEMLKEHADATTLMLDKIELVVQSPVIWGTFTVPGQTDITTFNLAELALQNLIAVPLGDKTLRFQGGNGLPDWLTVSYLEGLISRIDTGRRYPALINSTLLNDPQESARRQQLFTHHLRIQLPLLALQCKIRGQYGIDERGYRYVAALMQEQAVDRQVDGLRINLRPLAFVPQRRSDNSEDEVQNMYVIGPQDVSAGPCLLYRPLLDPPLIQYPSPTNLLYAVQQSSRLRESVLAWLPDDAREDYTRYVFPGALPSPWAAAEFLVDPLKLWTLSGPMSVGVHALEGDIFALLYMANAQAMAELANRQSVSNAEARWETFKRAGWLIFNAALPFLGRTAGAAAWLWQIMDQLQQVVDASEHPEQQSLWEALSELLLNLGMAAALHGLSRDGPKARPEPPIKRAPGPRRPSKPKVQQTTRLATLSTDELPTTHLQPLHTLGAMSRTPARLSAVLERFKVAKPATLGEPIKAPGAHLHLYLDAGKYYAPVGSRWFEVKVDENDTVLIVDSTQPERTGPPLISNRQGNWFVDTRLRLRGGGPKSMLRKSKTLAEKRAEQLRKQLSDFENDKKKALSELQQAHQAMVAAPSTSAQASRQTYLQILETQRNDYETALQQLKELNVHAPIADYSQKALNYLKAQTELTRADIRDALTDFTPTLRTVLDQIDRQAEEPQERHIEDSRRMSALNRQMIQHLEYMQGRFVELRKLQRDGLRLINTIKSTLPAYDIDALKALQVALSRNLCLNEQTERTEPQAWSMLDSIVDTAGVAIQCLRDTLDEQSENRLDERFDTLSNLIEQFRLVDERLVDLKDQHSAHVLDEPLQRLRDQLSEFKRRAVINLALASAERETLRNRPAPPPTPPRPQKRFIRTRYSGQLIGEPRLTSIGLDTGLVDIFSPITRKVVATYHEKTPGLWVERIKTPPVSRAAVDVQTSVRRGQALLDELPAFLARAETMAAQPERNPIGIEYLYHQQAKHLEQAVSAIESALTQSNVTEDANLPASWVTKALTEAIANLYRKSNEQVIHLLKQHPPTVAAVEWLKHQNAITIKQTIIRRRLKSPARDYLDEYTLIDSNTHKPLWYAHFHYSTSWTPAKTYLSGRLKTVEEHGLGAAADTPKGLSDEQKTAFYRSEISLGAARRLFFGDGT